MSEEKTIDLEEIPLDQLRELAGKEDTSVDEEPKEEQVEPAKTSFRREIDLGDGSGKQVFEADTLEGLLDKLTEAQFNATKKIREQEARLKQVTPAKKDEPKPELSEDEEFVLSQELLSHPSLAVKKIFKQMTGYDITEFKTVADRAKAFEVVQAQQEELKRQETAADTFVAAHPEYVPNARNGARLQKALNLLISEKKTQGEAVDYPTLLEHAYRDLSESGLLEVKSNDSTVDEESTGAVKPRIVATEDVVSAQRKKASGLSTRGRNVATGRFEPNDEDLYTMPLDKLRELASKGM